MALRLGLSAIILVTCVAASAHAQDPGSAPEQAQPPAAPPSATATTPPSAAPAPPPPPRPQPPPAAQEKTDTKGPTHKKHEGSFTFGSYGRIIAASDASGRPARDSDIVAHGSRLDHQNYVELELRRDDRWHLVHADTRVVATLAVGHPIFHYTGDFDVKLAVRNLYLEERGLGTKGLSVWAGSRMLRGDDIYLLDFWPLDNLNTLGGGIRYEAATLTTAQIHMGFGRPDNPFYRQQAVRPVPLNQFGAATIDLLDRQRWIGSARLEQQFRFGRGPAGMKLVGYAEAHRLPAGQRETRQAGVYQDVPSETGFVVGGQVGAFSGRRDVHVNVFVRYARGLAAYGEFSNPEGLSADHTTSGARELLIALGGNWEIDRFALMLGGYIRSFRNASAPLDIGDVDEGIVVLRPQVWFLDWMGLALEGSYQMQQRGVLVPGDSSDPNPKPLVAKMPRIGVMPFLSPAGRGSYSRPMIWLIYSAGFRNEGARALYPVDDPFRDRKTEHFIGFGAEWWFGSTSYGGGP